MISVNMEPMFIKDIRPGSKNINVTVIVLEVGNPITVKDNREVRTVKVADATACINLSVWDEPGHFINPGDIIRLTKAHATIFRNCLTLYSGKTGEIDKIGDFCMVFNEQMNMSDPNMQFDSLAAPINNGNLNNGGKHIRAPGPMILPNSGPQPLAPKPAQQRFPVPDQQPPLRALGAKLNNQKPGRGGAKGIVRPERR